MVQLNLQALTSTIAAAVSAAVKDAMATQHQASVPASTTTARGQVDHLVNEEISNLTQPTGTQGADPPFSPLSVGDEPSQLFTSIGVDLGARVSSKIWAHEYINAMQNIRQVNVRSPQPTSAPKSENPDHNLLIQVLDSQPVTPVKTERFENLLAGYSPALKTLLVDGFRNGFRISYIGELSSFESPNLQSAL